MMQRNFSYYLVAIALLCAGATVNAASDDIFDQLPGEWGGNQANTCESNPHVISVSEDRRRVVFKYQSPPGVAIHRPGKKLWRLSPEHGSADFINFDVLDHGKNWIALRREGETNLDRRGKVQVWKLTLKSDNKGYRWFLYNSVARKKSLLRGIRCSSKRPEPVPA